MVTGLDVMCQMIGRGQTPASLTALRGELADYLMMRTRVPWMHDFMAHLQEIDEKDVQRYRSGGSAVQIDDERC